MAHVTINFGTGNSATRDVGHTDNIRNDRALYGFLGASPENTVLLKNGSEYSGPLADGDVLDIQTRANKKN